jgi:hypothetical protein
MLGRQGAAAMSQLPPPSPFQPPYGLPYSGYATQRPGVITGLAVTGIVLGSVGILCNGIGLLAQLFLIVVGKNPVTANAPVMKDPLINGVGVASAVISLVLSIMLLVDCIGALRLKPGAHSGLIRWSWMTLVWATVSFVMQAVWILPATADFVLAQQTRTGSLPPPGMAAGFRFGQVIGAGIVWIIWCILPVLFLTLWRSPQVLAAFGKAPDGPAQPSFPGT